MGWGSLYRNGTRFWGLCKLRRRSQEAFNRGRKSRSANPRLPNAMSRRVMPKLRSGRKPLSTQIGRGTKQLILAAIRAWEIKHGIPHYPSVWGKRKSGL